jgi:outer membrane protein assembly factor BamB
MQTEYQWRSLLQERGSCPAGTAVYAALSSATLDIGKAADAILKAQLAKRPGEKLWAFNTGSKVNSTPAVDRNGDLYFGNLDNKVYAVEGTTGKKKWEVEVGAAVVLSSPALDDRGTMFIGLHDGKFLALDTGTGKQKWQYDTGAAIHTSPARGADGTLYVGNKEGRFYALDEKTGEMKWSYDTRGEHAADSWGSAATSPAIGPDGTVYVGGAGGVLHALEGKSGKPKWQSPVSYTFSSKSAPAVGPDGTIYIGCNDYKLHALDGATGNEKWTFTAHGFPTVRPAIGDDGTVYLGGDVSVLYAVDGATGKLRWEAPLEGRGTSPPLFHEGTVYIHVGKGSTENTVYAFDTRTGREQWHFKPTGGPCGVGSGPAVGKNGEIYVGNDNGYVYALKGLDPEKLPSEVMNDAQSAQAEEEKDTLETGDGYIMIDGIKMPINAKNCHVPAAIPLLFG